MGMCVNVWRDPWDACDVRSEFMDSVVPSPPSPSSPPSAEPRAKKQKSESSANAYTHTLPVAPAADQQPSHSYSTSASQSIVSPRFHPDSVSACRSPATFNSDLSATPIHLPASDPSLFTPLLPSSVASANTHTATAVAAELEQGVQHMFQEDSKVQQAEQKSAAAHSKPAAAAAAEGQTAAAAAAASSNAPMSSSAHSSRGSSRAHSPVDDGAGQEQLLQSTSSTSAAAQPQARPNNTAKSTDPAGQTISEAELEGRFKVIRYLGKGSYGTVFVAEEKATGKQVAIKKIPKVTQHKITQMKLTSDARDEKLEENCEKLRIQLLTVFFVLCCVC